MAKDKKEKKTKRRSSSSAGQAKKETVKSGMVKKTKKTVSKEGDKKFAVIKTGGKQYKVREGEEVLIEKIEGKEGKIISFKDVLLVTSGERVKIGNPIVSDSRVEAEILSQDKGPKVIVFKMKPKKRYRRKQGHRQRITRIKIKKIS